MHHQPQAPAIKIFHLNVFLPRFPARNLKDVNVPKHLLNLQADHKYFLHTWWNNKNSFYQFLFVSSSSLSSRASENIFTIGFYLALNNDERDDVLTESDE